MFMRFKNFEMRPCGEHNRKIHDAELVKWQSGLSGEYCYVLAFFDWDKEESYWNFLPVGLRFIEDYEDGLCEYVKKVLDLLAFTVTREE